MLAANDRALRSHSLKALWHELDQARAQRGQRRVCDLRQDATSALWCEAVSIKKRQNPLPSITSSRQDIIQVVVFAT